MENKARRVPAIKIEVNVTASLIDRAVRRNSFKCWIAEAIKIARPDVSNVSVDLQATRFTDPKTRLRYLFLTPRICQLAIIHFDRGQIPEPFQFILTKPAGITRGRGPANPEETLEQKIEKRRKRQKANKAAKHLYATNEDKPFAPPIEATHKVRRAMDDPYAPLGPVIALQGANAANDAVEVLIGGSPPPYRRGRNPGTNIIKQRRFGAHDLIE